MAKKIRTMKRGYKGRYKRGLPLASEQSLTEQFKRQERQRRRQGK